MKRYKRATKMLMAVNYNENSSFDEGTNKKDHLNEDPFENGDDDIGDPTYVPEKEKRGFSLTRESSRQQQTCEYISCTSEVFAACDKCSSFLCWDHFDSVETSNYCEYHSRTIDELHEFDETITYQDRSCPKNYLAEHCVEDAGSNKTLFATNPIYYQHCEFKACFGDVSSKCTECQGLLCALHYNIFITDKDCSMHKSFTMKYSNKTSSAKKQKLSNKSASNIEMDNFKPVNHGLNEGLQNSILSSLRADVIEKSTPNLTLSDNIFSDYTRSVQTSYNNDSESAAPTYQHCEYEACFEEVSSTCTNCQGFLCVLHFNKFITDKNCSMHKSFSTEIPDSLEAKQRRKSKKRSAKINRNLGLEYINSKKKVVAARSLKEPLCNLKASCKFKCCEIFEKQIRKRIFDSYWALGDVNRQRDFIRRHSEEIRPKYRYPCANCNSGRKLRGMNYAFYFEVENKKYRVCKQFFMSTLDINDRVIKTVREKTNIDGFVSEDLRGKHENRFKLSGETEEVRKFISAIPRVESHYLRAQTTREYIEGGKTLTQLYNDYQKSCVEQSKPCVSKSTFSKIFHTDFNISFFTPKKDRCEICVSYENSSEAEKAQMQESFDNHQREKELSRAEKRLDKEKASPLYVVACYDLQAVLTTPRGDVSVFYYISKLATYNLTVCELVTSLTTCFVWHEGQGQRGVTEIGSCIFKFLEKKSQQVNSDDLDIVFYSDNCCGQQKNKYMTALYIYAINKLKIKSITHKFLIKGHTQNEVDSVHSSIEKAIKRSLKSGPIYCPQDYICLIKTAKRNPPFYAVEELSFSDFYDIKSMCDQAGNNFSKSTNNETVKVADIKILQVLKEDPYAFYVKTSYADDYFKRIEIRKKVSTRKMTNFILPDALNKAYTEKIKISEKKKQDILKLIEKRHIPQIYFDFYNTL